MKLCVEQVVKIDIRQMKFISGDHGVIMTPNENQVNYYVDDYQLYLDSHHQEIMIDKTPCNYGGHRSWFLCPKCYKRAAVLYERERLFLCRECHDLPYTSQRVSEENRLQLKARKMRVKLATSRDLTQPIMDKPKGMHWKTFKRLKKDERLARCNFVLAMARKLKICNKYASNNL